jgi:hypothetical protein
LLDVNCGKTGHVPSSRGRRNDDDQSVVVEWGNNWNNYLSRLNRPVYIGRNQPGGLGSCFVHQSHRGQKKKTSTGDNVWSDDHAPAAATIMTIHNMYPSWFVSSGSHIVDYLRMKHSKLMQHHVLFPEHMQRRQEQHNNCNNNNCNRGDASAYETLIQDKLNYILLALRYGNDPVWEGVYKEQCIRASLDPDNTSSLLSSITTKQQQQQKRKRWRFFSLWARYQTYSERVLALYNLIPSRWQCASIMTPQGGGGGGSLALELFRYNDYRYGDGVLSKGLSPENDDNTNETDMHHHQHHPFSSVITSYGGVGGADSGNVNVYRALEYADCYYTSLEEKLLLADDDNSPTTYFLGTSTPSYIDALLFSHLAEALCDVYLVLVLAKHSRLMKYFQYIYDQYFGEKYVDTIKRGEGGEVGSDKVDDSDVEWIKWNNVSNSLNAFNQIPETASFGKNGFGGKEGDHSQSGIARTIHLMQRLAIHCHELDEAMRDAAALRLKCGRERSVLENQHRPFGSRLYQWLMGLEVNLWGPKHSYLLQKSHIGSNVCESKTNHNGDDAEEEKAEEVSKEEMWRKHMEQVKRDRRYSDEVWISGVIITFFVAIVFSTSQGKK